MTATKVRIDKAVGNILGDSLCNQREIIIGQDLGLLSQSTDECHVERIHHKLLL